MINWALPWLKLPWFIKKYQKIKPPIRHLTDGEVALALSVFGELMDYSRVRVVNYPYIPWQSDDVFIAPNGWIFVGGRHYRDDFSAHGRLYQQIFIHEMTHVLQYQHGINVLLRGAWLQTLHYLSLKNTTLIDTPSINARAFGIITLSNKGASPSTSIWARFPTSCVKDTKKASPKTCFFVL